jgi:hypothetical protein
MRAGEDGSPSQPHRARVGEAEFGVERGAGAPHEHAPDLGEPRPYPVIERAVPGYDAWVQLVAVGIGAITGASLVLGWVLLTVAEVRRRRAPAPAVTPPSAARRAASPVPVFAGRGPAQVAPAMSRRFVGPQSVTHPASSPLGPWRRLVAPWGLSPATAAALGSPFGAPRPSAAPAVPLLREVAPGLLPPPKAPREGRIPNTLPGMDGAPPRRRRDPVSGQVPRVSPAGQTSR